MLPTLEELQTVCELAKTQSMGVCAENLHMTKANVSRSIANMERKLGLTLFVRTHKGSRLTPMGEIVRDQAQGIIDSCYALPRLNQPDNASVEPLSIVSTESQNKITHDLIALLNADEKVQTLRITTTPDPHLSIGALSPDIVLGTIQRSEIKTLDPYRELYTAYSLNESPLCAAIPTAKAESALTEISVRALSGRTLLLPSSLLSADSTHSTRFESYLTSHNVHKSTRIIECNSAQMARSLLNNDKIYLSDEHGCRLTFAEEILKGSVTIATIIPTEPIIRYMAIKRETPYYQKISDVLSALLNASPEQFEIFEKLF